MPTPDALRGDRQALAERCRGLDGQAYPAYRDLVGGWALGGGLTLFLDRAARDPFAPNSPSGGGCRRQWRRPLRPEFRRDPYAPIARRRSRPE